MLYPDGRSRIEFAKALDQVADGSNANASRRQALLDCDRTMIVEIRLDIWNPCRTTVRVLPCAAAVKAETA
jgi:hypothetical protein